MNYQNGDLVKIKRNSAKGHVGIIVKHHHPCTDFWHVALLNTIEIFHGAELEPLEAP